MKDKKLKNINLNNIYIGKEKEILNTMYKLNVVTKEEMIGLVEYMSKSLYNRLLKIIGLNSFIKRDDLFMILDSMKGPKRYSHFSIILLNDLIEIKKDGYILKTKPFNLKNSSTDFLFTSIKITSFFSSI